MTRQITASLVVCAFAFLSALQVHADTLTTASGINGADTWVASNQADTVLGIEDAKRIRVRSAGNFRKAYLRFFLLGLIQNPVRPSADRIGQQTATRVTALRFVGRGGIRNAQPDVHQVFRRRECILRIA